MFKKTITGFAIILCLLAAAPRAFGQLGVYAGFFGGYSSNKPSLPDTATLFSTNTTFCYGFRVGVNIMMVGLEGVYMQAAHNISWESGLFPNWDGKELDFNYLGVNFKYFLPIPVLRPYLTAGYGYYSADIFNIDKGSDGGFNFGAGLDVQLSKRFGLVVEAKYHHANIDLDIQHLKFGIGDFAITGGLNIYLF